MQSKKELIHILDNKSDLLLKKRYNDKTTQLQTYMLERYEFQKGYTMDYVSRRTQFEAAPEYELYCLGDGINQVFNNCIKLDDYFSNVEIKEYSKFIKDNNKIEFPIYISCVQISDDQWIGKTDVQFFVKLRKASMIKYNANAQRALKRITKGDSEFWRIQLNKLAVSQIKEAYHNNIYIPNTITLNISDEANCKFTYEEENHRLRIDSLDFFDISDGYHRYIAMTQEYDFNNDFNYPMELRIINFDDEKVKQFIFQEDQKTKMTKLSSNSMNVNKSCNKVVERLNSSNLCYLKGNITRNGGTIDFSLFSDLVDQIFFNRKNASNKEEYDIAKDIQSKLNTLIEFDDKYMNEKYSYARMISVLLGIKYCEDSFKLNEYVDRCEDSIKNEKFVKSRKFSKKEEMILKDLFE